MLPDHGLRVAVWAVAALTDLSVPLLARRRLVQVPFDPARLTERFGTFIIIALGETVVATAAGADPLDPIHVCAAVVTLVFICAMWWVYFQFGPDAILAALRGSTALIDLIRPVLSYGHLMLIAVIVAVAAGTGHAVAEPLEPLAGDTAALLCGGTALYLVTFAFTRWKLFHTVAVPRLTAAFVVLGRILVATRIDALWVVALLAVVIVVLNVVEHFVLPRTLSGRRGNGGMPHSH